MDPITEMSMVMFAVLVIVLILVVVFINQRYRYQKLREDLEGYLKELKDQERAIKKLENDLREYVMGGKGLRDWSMLKQQINELSDLPSFTETENEYVLRTHLSRIKKDYVKVSGIKKGIKVSIDSKEGLPLQTLYSTPKDIDPHGLKVTYRGNTLEIRAPKSIVENNKKDKKKSKGE